MALYTTYLTNYYGFKLKKSLKLAYSKTLLEKLKINVRVINED